MHMVHSCVKVPLKLQSHCTVKFGFLLLTAKPKHRLGCALFLLKNRFLALVLPNLNRSGYNFAHTPIVVRNTPVGRLRPRSAYGQLQAKSKRLCFCSTCNAP